MCQIKILVYLRSFLKFTKLKIIFENKIRIHPINSLRDKLVININGRGRLKIGKFLMVDGPLYIKVENEGNLELGDRVFLIIIVV